jgi:hypothetical protein
MSWIWKSIAAIIGIWLVFFSGILEAMLGSFSELERLGLCLCILGMIILHELGKIRERLSSIEERLEKAEKDREENEERLYSYYDAFDDENTDEEQSPKKPQSKKEKLESKLKDLNAWLQLGLVPKKDLKRHEQEIDQLKKEIGKRKKNSKK